MIACLIVASGAFIYALNGLMSNDSGWTSIEASSSAETNCGDDFVFQYYVGAAGVDATAEKKALTLLYTDALVKAYEVFHNDEAFEGVNNIYEINQHPNEELTVDPVLYRAFETVAEYGRREIYLAPVYLEYKNLFFCNDDSETFHYDAEQNADVRTYFGEIAAYANDLSMVNVELLGDNRLKLHVSEEYLAYARENGIEKFVDFAWMQNAFITDYLAEFIRELRKEQFGDALDKYFRLGKNLNQRDTIAVRKMVGGYIKLLYPDGEYTKEEIEEILQIALEMRRRVKEQLKKLGGMEFYDVNFSYIDNETFEEHYVSVPEQSGGKLIPEGMCNPGQVYTVSNGKSGMIGVFRLESQMLQGSGKFERTGIGTDREAKESSNTTFSYLKANGKRISGTISTDNKDYTVFQCGRCSI